MGRSINIITVGSTGSRYVSRETTWRRHAQRTSSMKEEMKESGPKDRHAQKESGIESRMKGVDGGRGYCGLVMTLGKYATT